jgi:gamma-glutamylcyclotransferase (GGCT)/AIG2-like uncharacterized protein YtfP
MTTLFVYGTLLPGEVRWHHLAPYVTDDGTPDAVPGTLYDTGLGYPAFRATGTSFVHGRRFTLVPDTLAAALAHLDAVEGAVRGLYRRITVRSVAGFDVELYEYGADGTHGALDLVAIPGGDWLRR